jgi:hypothetical protein
MNSQIKIVDEFLSEEEFIKVVSKYKNKDATKWELQSSSFKPDELQFLKCDLSDDEFYNTYLYKKVVNQLHQGHYELSRVYLNGQWNGREGDLHKDGCYYTALIYMSPYRYGNGGFTEIMTEPEPTLIHPIPNRLVIFSGNIHHKAYSFAYQTDPLRVTLAFKINQK